MSIFNTKSKIKKLKFHFHFEYEKRLLCAYSNQFYAHYKCAGGGGVQCAF
jgi:hypothetical protein